MDISIFSDITMACLGDSITYGIIPAYGGNYKNYIPIQMNQPYPYVIQKILGLKEVYNHGINNSTITSGKRGYAPFVERYVAIPSTTNIILVMGGTNDCIRNCPIGTKNDLSTTQTFYGALNTLCLNLKKRCPHSYIFFTTPLPTIEANDAKFLPYINAINSVCDVYKIPVLDLYKCSGFESEFTEEYSDKLHPSQKFVLEHLAPQIADFIQNNIIF